MKILQQLKLHKKQASKIIKTLKLLIKTNFKSFGLVFAFVLAIASFATIFAEITYRPQEVIKRGFAIILDESGKVVAKKAEPVADFTTLFASADKMRGEKIFKKCASCHSINRGEGAKVGPNLHGIISRAKGSSAGFSYSEALKAKGGNWSKEEINLFITKPKEYIKGTKMAFAGLKKPQDRADVIFYLQENAKK